MFTFDLSLQQGNIRLTAIIVMAKLKYSDSETNILIKEISDKKQYSDQKQYFDSEKQDALNALVESPDLDV